MTCEHEHDEWEPETNLARLNQYGIQWTNEAIAFLLTQEPDDDNQDTLEYLVASRRFAIDWRHHLNLQQRIDELVGTEVDPPSIYDEPEVEEEDDDEKQEWNL